MGISLPKAVQADFSRHVQVPGGLYRPRTKYSPKKLTLCGNIYHFRVFYLESSSPELKESSIIMKIGFKFAKFEYFENLQESVENVWFTKGMVH